jgi:hypothetical protein
MNRCGSWSQCTVCGLPRLSMNRPSGEPPSKRQGLGAEEQRSCVPGRVAVVWSCRLNGAFLMPCGSCLRSVHKRGLGYPMPDQVRTPSGWRKSCRWPPQRRPAHADGARSYASDVPHPRRRARPGPGKNHFFHRESRKRDRQRIHILPIRSKLSPRTALRNGPSPQGPMFEQV